MSKGVILALDQGTTSTRALVVDEKGVVLGSSAVELTQYYPQPGWVEHDANEIWAGTAQVVPSALEQARRRPCDIVAIGITNQRETIVFWDRRNSKPLARALVWQDRRTSEFCRQRRSDEGMLAEKTGLVLDPYFSATKIRWLLDQDPSWRRQAEEGTLACGTIDSWLLWNLTGGANHATDFSNASRTLLLDIHKGAWCPELCRFFSVPQALLPRVLPSAAPYGVTAELGFLPAGIPITGIAGDQQAALFGQGAFEPGEAKCTYGTGAFFLLHTGTSAIRSRHRLLTSLAALTSTRLEYVLEGSVFIAGAAVQWLRDGIHFIERSHEVEGLAQQSDPAQPVIFVPAFVGLGAPHWIPEARGVLFGLTRNTTPADLARAALEGVAYQVTDLVEAADRDAPQPLAALRVDGGMAQNDWFLQRQADILGKPVIASPQKEATALGAAFLAGLKAGVWTSCEDLRRLSQTGRSFTPRWPDVERAAGIARWRRAVRNVIDFYTDLPEPSH
jgi:glycerol kinase